MRALDDPWAGTLDWEDWRSRCERVDGSHPVFERDRNLVSAAPAIEPAPETVETLSVDEQIYRCGLRSEHRTWRFAQRALM